jgi:biotin carboxylase
VFDKPDPLEGPFFEETIYVTPSRLAATEQQRIVDQVGRGARALGLTHGPVHAECRLAADGKIYILEIAARPIGGLCSRVLTFATGASLEEGLLRHAVGEPIGTCVRERRAAAVMMIPIPRRGVFKRMTGEDRARAVPGITEVRITAKPGQRLEPLPEAGSYLGFIFARGSAPADAEAAVRHAHRSLEPDIARDLRVQ